MTNNTQDPAQNRAQRADEDQSGRSEILEGLPRGLSKAPMLTKWTGEVLKAADGGEDAPGIGAFINFVLSTDEVDRHGDVVSADGWKLDSYRKNPVLLWAHDYRHPAIGRAVELWNEPHRLLAKMEFAPGQFAQEVASLYRSGFQWGVSVGFKPLRFEERRDERTGAFLGVRFLEQELLEVSAVPVPANRSALRRSAGTGLGESSTSELHALWPVLAAQADDLSKMAEELLRTVAEMETAISADKPEGNRGLERAGLSEVLGVLRSARQPGRTGV